MLWSKVYGLWTSVKTMAERFWLAFLLLFVAFDVVGVLPFYWTLAQGLPATQRRQAVHQAVLVAFLVALAPSGPRPQPIRCATRLRL